MDAYERWEREKENVRRVGDHFLKWLPAQTAQATASLLASSERMEGLTRSLKRYTAWLLVLTTFLSVLTAVLAALTVVLITKT